MCNDEEPNEHNREDAYELFDRPYQGGRSCLNKRQRAQREWRGNLF